MAEAACEATAMADALHQSELSDPAPDKHRHHSLQLIEPATALEDPAAQKVQLASLK